MSADKARSDLAGYERTIRTMREKLAELEAHADKVRIYIEMADLYDGGRSIPASAAPAISQAGPRIRTRDGIVEKARSAVAKILRDQMKPSLTRDLLEKLSSQGVIIGGSSPISNLSGMLSKSPEFRNAEGGWRLVEWDDRQQSSGINPSPENTADKSHVDAESFGQTSDNHANQTNIDHKAPLGIGESI